MHVRTFRKTIVYGAEEKRIISFASIVPLPCIPKSSKKGKPQFKAATGSENP